MRDLDTQGIKKKNFVHTLCTCVSMVVTTEAAVVAGLVVVAFLVGETVPGLVVVDFGIGPGVDVVDFVDGDTVLGLPVVDETVLGLPVVLDFVVDATVTGVVDPLFLVVVGLLATAGVVILLLLSPLLLWAAVVGTVG